MISSSVCAHDGVLPEYSAEGDVDTVCICCTCRSSIGLVLGCLFSIHELDCTDLSLFVCSSINRILILSVYSREKCIVFDTLFQALSLHMDPLSTGNVDEFLWNLIWKLSGVHSHFLSRYNTDRVTSTTSTCEKVCNYTEYSA
jgi:hypothetical protein